MLLGYYLNRENWGGEWRKPKTAKLRLYNYANEPICLSLFSSHSLLPSAAVRVVVVCVSLSLSGWWCACALGRVVQGRHEGAGHMSQATMFGLLKSANVPAKLHPFRISLYVLCLTLCFFSLAPPLHLRATPLCQVPVHAPRTPPDPRLFCPDTRVPTPLLQGRNGHSDGVKSNG